MRPDASVREGNPHNRCPADCRGVVIDLYLRGALAVLSDRYAFVFINQYICCPLNVDAPLGERYNCQIKEINSFNYSTRNIFT
jgi:hypothetical protein